MPVTRLVAPGPLVAMQTPARAGRAGITFRRERPALFVPRQNRADRGLGQRLVEFHARAAGIGENRVHAFAFEAGDEDFAALHGAGRLRRAWRAAVLFGGFNGFAHFVFSVCGWRPRVDNKKPTTVASRGFLSKSCSASTSPGGIAGYDDRDYQDLLNIFNHFGESISGRVGVKH